jgi:hypothetical protein
MNLPPPNQNVDEVAPPPLPGADFRDSEVLEAEPVRQGGLMRKDTVRYFE